MIQLYIDTCVWRYWLTLKNGGTFEKSFFEENARAFDRIYEHVSSQPQNFLFLYTVLTERELTDKYLFELPYNFDQIKTTAFIKFTPIHNTRWDGISRYVGDGGTFGGGISLREVFDINTQYDHEAAIQIAPKKHQFGQIEYSNARKKEFDIEHAEAALEAGADVFLTTDSRFRETVTNASKHYPKHEHLRRIREICLFPVEALSKIFLKPEEEDKNIL